MVDLLGTGKQALAAFSDILTTQVKAGKQLDGQTVEKPTFWIQVTEGMSGYFAVKLWNGMGFPEPWESGDGRYDNRADAAEEAKRWAEEEGIEYK